MAKLVRAVKSGLESGITLAVCRLAERLSGTSVAA